MDLCRVFATWYYVRYEQRVGGFIDCLIEEEMFLLAQFISKR